MIRDIKKLRGGATLPTSDTMKEYEYEKNLSRHVYAAKKTVDHCRGASS